MRVCRTNASLPCSRMNSSGSWLPHLEDFDSLVVCQMAQAHFHRPPCGAITCRVPGRSRRHAAGLFQEFLYVCVGGCRAECGDHVFDTALDQSDDVH